jgi:transcriptional repressor NrdR
MKCPFCATLDTKVIDSRLNQIGDMTRRRRECPNCEGRFTTYERVEDPMPMVIKKDGRREPFIREKILSGLKKACQKRTVATSKIEDLVTSIEKDLQSYVLKEVPTRTIGYKVMSALHRMDKVAYVRFASVYREFRDVEEFVHELQSPLWTGDLPLPPGDQASPENNEEKLEEKASDPLITKELSSC